MGYSTDFRGIFNLNKKLDDETYIFLKKLSETRRMKRNVDAKYGVDGEFYVDGGGFAGQDVEDNVLDSNKPPRTQPGLWCQWTPSQDRKSIMWNGGEKFYDYIEWLEYIVERILKPRGYTLTGDVYWQGEDPTDIGLIHADNNNIKVKPGRILYD